MKFLLFAIGSCKNLKNPLSIIYSKHGHLKNKTRKEISISTESSASDSNKENSPPYEYAVLNYDSVPTPHDEDPTPQDEDPTPQDEDPTPQDEDPTPQDEDPTPHDEDPTPPEPSGDPAADQPPPQATPTGRAPPPPECGDPANGASANDAPVHFVPNLRIGEFHLCRSFWSLPDLNAPSCSYAISIPSRASAPLNLDQPLLVESDESIDYLIPNSSSSSEVTISDMSSDMSSSDDDGESSDSTSEDSEILAPDSQQEGANSGYSTFEGVTVDESDSVIVGSSSSSKRKMDQKNVTSKKQRVEDEEEGASKPDTDATEKAAGKMPLYRKKCVRKMRRSKPAMDAKESSDGEEGKCFAKKSPLPKRGGGGQSGTKYPPLEKADSSERP